MARRDLLAALATVLVLTVGCASEAPTWVRSGQAGYAEPVSLPAPRLTGTVPLESAIAARRSTRTFRDEPLEQTVIAQLLWAGQGVTSDDGKRSAPSAGGLYPLELYAVTAEELMHYLPDGHRAEARAAPDLRSRMQEAAFDQPAVGSAPLLLVVAGVPARTEVKYGARGATYVAQEAGHAAQNVLLQATALGLASVPVGGVDPARVAEVLSLPSDEEVFYVIPVGWPP